MEAEWVSVQVSSEVFIMEKISQFVSRSLSRSPLWNRSAVWILPICLLLTVTGNCSDERVLFDGSTLDGWAHTGAGYFNVDENEKCLVSHGGMGMLFYYDRQFEDFDLTLEFSVNREEANSGVFVRFPNLPKIGGQPYSGPWGAVNEGYEFQIQGQHTGDLYSFQESSEVPLKKPGEYNRMKIEAIGQKYKVWVNGKLVGEYTGERSTRGYIGVQNHDPSSIVRFRNIRVTPK